MPTANDYAESMLGLMKQARRQMDDDNKRRGRTNARSSICSAIADSDSALALPLSPADRAWFTEKRVGLLSTLETLDGTIAAQ